MTRMIMPAFAAVLFSAAALHAATPAAQAARVLVVCNTKSTISKTIADDSPARRGVANVLNVTCQDAAVSTDSETITFKKYLSLIDAPLRSDFAANPGIDFIVMTKGVPIRLLGSEDSPVGQGRQPCAISQQFA